MKLLHAWKAFENEHGDEESQGKVAKLMPKKIKKRVHYVSEDGVSIRVFIYLNSTVWKIMYIFFLSLLQKDEGWEEKLEYIFPEDEASKPNIKILQQAKSWRNKMLQEGEASED